jgi:hypothetical protein
MMKNFTQTLTAAFIAVLLFSFGLANAQTVHFGDSGWPTKATSITGLSVNDKTYDVIFDTGQEAFNVFGDFPGVFTFDGETEGTAAAVAMDDALNAAGASHIGEIQSLPERGFEIFHIPYGTVDNGGPALNEVLMAFGSKIDGTVWNEGTENKLYNLDARNWTIFTTTGAATVLNEAFLGGVSISIFPNPAEDYIHIKTEEYIKSINMYDITGKVMQHFQLEVDGSTTLDVSEFNAGAYFLKLQDDKGDVNIRKFIIQ